MGPIVERAIAQQVAKFAAICRPVRCSRSRSRGAKPETPGLSLVCQILQRYRLSTTSKQFMAMILENSDEGDILRVLYGSKFPHSEVPGKEDTCTLIGSALMKIWGGVFWVSYEPTRESLCF